MNDLLNKEPVKRVIETLSKFNENLKVQILEKTARTAKEAANALNCCLLYTSPSPRDRG